MEGWSSPGARASLPAATAVRWSRVDGSCGAEDEGEGLWGPAAQARAVAASRDASTPVEGEAGLLRNMRKKLGPFARHQLALHHLRSARGKLHWAVNGYFRDAVLERPARGGADFEPRPVARPPHESATAAATEAAAALRVGVKGLGNAEEKEEKEEGKEKEEKEEEEEEEKEEAEEEESSVQPLPPLVWEMFLSRVPPADVCRLAAVSRVTRHAALSNSVWRRQYETRWGCTAAARVASRHRHSNIKTGLPPPPPMFDGRAQPHAIRRIGGEGFDGSGGGGNGGGAGGAGGGGGGGGGGGRGEEEEGIIGGPNEDDDDDDACGASGGGGGGHRDDDGDTHVDWFSAYRRRHGMERRMMCPECLSSKVLPIVYGFPSPPLVAALKKSRVLLGGDYLVEGDPSWACGACQSRWRTWPFAWPNLSDEDRSWADVSPHPGTSGSSGQGPGLGADLDNRHPV